MPRRVKHQFNSKGNRIHYESSSAVTGKEEWRPRAGWTFSLEYQCAKCGSIVLIERDAYEITVFSIRHPAPNRQELRNTPNCKRMRIIQRIMES